MEENKQEKSKSEKMIEMGNAMSKGGGQMMGCGCLIIIIVAVAFFMFMFV